MDTGKRLMGVGCFAKPQTLARVLKRAVEAYVMAPIESIDDFTRTRQYQNIGTRWLRHLISGQSDMAGAGGHQRFLSRGRIPGIEVIHLHRRPA